MKIILFAASCLFLVATTGFAADNQLVVPEKTPLSSMIDSSADKSADVDCFSYPGRQLCRDLRDFDNLLISCTGNACYRLWDQQLNTIDAIEDWYFYNIDRYTTVEVAVGSDSYEIARTLCATRVTGDPNYVYALAVAYNSLIDILEDLQARASLRVPYTCQFTID